MKTTGDLGKTGEAMAQEYLEKLGFVFVDANWSCKLGEVDLIMRDRDELVFVEVRLRRPTSYGQGLDTVAAQKQRKLTNTAKFYQQKMDYWGYLRFDVVSIEYEEGQKPIIEHIKDAF